MRKVEYAVKDGGRVVERGEVFAGNLSGEEVEQGIRAQSNFKDSRGGRPNRVEMEADVVLSTLEGKGVEQAAYSLYRACMGLSRSSCWRLEKRLEGELEDAVFSELRVLKQEFERGDR